MKILSGNYDGRSRSGLEKAIERMEAKDNPDVMQITIFKNLLKRVRLLIHLQESNLLTMDAEELRGCLDSLVAEEAEIPVQFQKRLLTRRARDLKLEGNHVKLLEILNPFVCADVFAVHDPCLAALQLEEAHKVKTFNEMIFEQLVMSWIGQGQPAAATLLDFALKAHALMSGVDFVEIGDYFRAKELGDHLVIWRALIALLKDEMDVSLQETWVPSSEGACPVFFWGGGGGKSLSLETNTKLQVPKLKKKVLLSHSQESDTG